MAQIRRFAVSVLLALALTAGALVSPASGSARAGSADLATTSPSNIPPGAFTGVTPFRALDTRDAGKGPCVSGLRGRTLKLTGLGGVPDDAAAVALNVTVTAPTADGFLTVYPAGQTLPTASNLNYLAGQTVPNMVTVALGTNGSITLYTLTGCPHVIVDIAGWYKAGAPVGDGGFTGVTPFRALDTRDVGKGPCVSGAGGRTLKLTGLGGVPDGAAAVALNVTVTAPSGPGFLTVYPAGATLPTASNLNYVAGQTVPNMVTVALGTNGSITLYAQNGCPHVIVDIAGWYTAAPADPGGFTGITPARVPRHPRVLVRPRRRAHPANLRRIRWPDDPDRLRLRAVVERLPPGEARVGRAQRHRHRTERRRLPHRLPRRTASCRRRRT